jgi:gamma-glutamyltranspeptidase/glutathione hydrolase
MGSGRAGADARIDLYRDHGRDEIPPRGPLAALTAPGAVAAWMLALEAAKAYGGRLPLATLLDPAIRCARDGCVVTRSHAQLIAGKLAELKDTPGFAATFLSDGKPPAVGTICRPRSPRLSIISPRPALRTSIAATSDARSQPI